MREWNIAHQKAGPIKHGQAQLNISDEMDVQSDRAKDLPLSATNGIDAAMKQNNLDGEFRLTISMMSPTRTSN